MPTSSADAPKESPLLGFHVEDSACIEQLAVAVRSLIRRPSSTPEQIHHLATLLSALNRLPRATEGVCIDLSCGYEHENGERDMLDLSLTADSFSVGNHQYIILHPSAGGDVESKTVFEVEGDYRETAEEFSLMEWVDQFRSRAADPDAKIDISDSADDCEIEWCNSPSVADWERTGSDYA